MTPPIVPRPDMTLDDDDVPTRVDFRAPEIARTWTDEADVKRPWRSDLRREIADAVRDAGARRVVELGAGPGLLAAQILATCELTSYTLLDFAPPMLALARERLGAPAAAHFVLADFRDPDWPALVERPVDAVVTMQAIHELRHRRRIPALYRQVCELLRPGGIFLLCDHEPPDARPLFTSSGDQLALLAGAGFTAVRTRLAHHDQYICEGRRPD